MMTIEKLTERINERGVKIDVKQLDLEISLLEKAVEHLSISLSLRVSQALDIALNRVNLNSSKTMVDFFYGYHQLPVTKITSKSKTPSLDSDTLSPFAHSNEDVKKYIEYRSYSKNLHLLNNIKKEVVYGDEVHTNFDCNGALSGRFTSQAPNLQQIPSSYRRLFVPRKGFSFLCIDLKQAEPTLAYALAGSPIDGDIYSKVANQLNISRDQAKVFNIGVSYGMTPAGLASLLKCSKSVAQAYINSWKLQNPQLVSYIQKINEDAAKNGFVSIYDNSHAVKDFFEFNTESSYQSNRAFNIHIQGSLAKLIKIAMINIQEFLDSHSPNSHIVLTEHDELVIELADSALQYVDKIVGMMENIDGFSFKSKHVLSDCWSK